MRHIYELRTEPYYGLSSLQLPLTLLSSNERKPVTKESQNKKVVLFCFFAFSFSLLARISRSMVSNHVINEHVFSTKTKASVCIRIEFNTQRISWGHQHGCRSFV